MEETLWNMIIGSQYHFSAGVRRELFFLSIQKFCFKETVE